MSVPTNKQMLKLGDFQFSVSTATMNKLKLNSKYRWETKSSPTKDSPELRQYVGRGDHSMTIDGVIYPQLIAGGLGYMSELRELAELGVLMQMVAVEAKGEVDNVGKVLGQWGITSISEERTLFLPDGTPREIHFTMQLESFNDRNL